MTEKLWHKKFSIKIHLFAKASRCNLFDMYILTSRASESLARIISTVPTISVRFCPFFDTKNVKNSETLVAIPNCDLFSDDVTANHTFVLFFHDLIHYLTEFSVKIHAKFREIVPLWLLH
jgi:hypothetical protein